MRTRVVRGYTKLVAGKLMSKQTNRIVRQCQKRLGRGQGRCINDATIGVYTWSGGETDVNLNKPVAVFCGEHKPRFDSRYTLRNVRLRR